MARYEFRFIVTDTELSEEHQRKVGQAVAEYYSCRFTVSA